MMNLYNVKDEYINYLRNFESKILFNKKEKRPYIGIVFSIESNNYYIPLASPKNKFLHMKNSKDIHKIAGGEYGVVNFINMIPVQYSELIPIEIEKENDILYRNLLRNQLIELTSISDVLKRKAINIYKLFTTENELSKSDKIIKSRCCNFPLLEQKMNEYINLKAKQNKTIHNKIK